MTIIPPEPEVRAEWTESGTTVVQNETTQVLPAYTALEADPLIDPIPPLWSQWWFWVSLAAPVLLIVAAIAILNRDDSPTEAITGPTTTVVAPAPETLPVPSTVAIASTPAPTQPLATTVVTAPPSPTLPTPTAAPQPTPAPTLAPTPAPTPAPTLAPTPAPTAAPTSAPATTFGNGDHVVGTQIRPGRYTAPGGAGCQWQRLTSAGDELGAFVGTGQTVVDLSAPETMRVTGCGTFAPSSTVAAPKPAVADGTWILGVDVAAGRWRTAGGPTCAWARLADFGGSVDSVLEEGSANSETVIGLAPTDAGFLTQGGCTWTPAP